MFAVLDVVAAVGLILFARRVRRGHRRRPGAGAARVMTGVYALIVPARAWRS